MSGVAIRSSFREHGRRAAAVDALAGGRSDGVRHGRSGCWSGSARELRRCGGLRGVPRGRDRRLARLTSRARDASRGRRDRARPFRRRGAHESRRHVDLHEEGRQALDPHRGARRKARRLRGRVHLRRRAAPAISGRVPERPLPGAPVAWDTRPKAQGGQRWFSLQPNEKIPPGDLLHWTGVAGNWNQMCAACHSTDLRKPLRRDGRFLRNDVERPRRRLRSLSRTGLESRGVGEGGRESRAGLRFDAGTHGAALASRSGALGDEPGDGHREARSAARIARRSRDLRAVSRAPQPRERGAGRAGQAAARHGPPRAARRAALSRRRPDPGRGLRVRFRSRRAGCTRQASPPAIVTIRTAASCTARATIRTASAPIAICLRSSRRRPITTIPRARRARAASRATCPRSSTW